jgi:CcmD family protein
MMPMGIYYTLAVTLIIWIGLFLYLIRLDRRISDLETGE